MTGDWEIFHPVQDSGWSYKSKWQANKLVCEAHSFFDAYGFLGVNMDGYELDDLHCIFAENRQQSWDGETFQISHVIYDERYVTPDEIFNCELDMEARFKVTYKLQDTRILERDIVQYPYKGSREITIATETFDENGALKNVELHSAIHKHNAYMHPLMFKEWSYYGLDYDTLNAREIKEFQGTNNFGYGYKRNSTTKNLDELYCFAWGEKNGISMHFGNDNQVKMLKWEGKEIIWDQEKGIGDNNKPSQRKKIQDMFKEGEPPFDK